MSKYIGKTTDKWGNIIYVTGFDGKNVEYNSTVGKAILLSADDKKIISKILRKQSVLNLTYIKLEKFDRIGDTTFISLRDYEYDFITKNPAKYLRHEDEMHLECIDYAKNYVDEVNTFKEFGDKVAEILIKKYKLQKKDS